MTDGTAPNIDWSRFVGAAEQRLREVRAAVASGDFEDAREALAEVRQLAREAELALSAVALQIAETVAEQPDGEVGAVGLLLERAVYDVEYRQMVARNELTELLPRLERQHLEALHPHYREMLGRALSRRAGWGHPDFLIAVLGAVERVGEVTAIWNVERLANLRRPRPADQPVVAAARRCLDSLYKQAGRSREAETLLRGASAPDDADRLVRPAGKADNNPAELLRSAQADTTE